MLNFVTLFNLSKLMNMFGFSFGMIACNSNYHNRKTMITSLKCDAIKHCVLKIQNNNKTKIVPTLISFVHYYECENINISQIQYKYECSIYFQNKKGVQLTSFEFEVVTWFWNSIQQHIQFSILFIHLQCGSVAKITQENKDISMFMVLVAHHALSGISRKRCYCRFFFHIKQTANRKSRLKVMEILQVQLHISSMYWIFPLKFSSSSIRTKLKRINSQIAIWIAIQLWHIFRLNFGNPF